MVIRPILIYFAASNPPFLEKATCELKESRKKCIFRTLGQDFLESLAEESNEDTITS